MNLIGNVLVAERLFLFTVTAKKNLKNSVVVVTRLDVMNATREKKGKKYE